MRGIIFNNKILRLKIINIRDGPSNPQSWKRARLPLNLNLHRLDMILVYVRIPHCMDKFARIHVTDMGNHPGQERVGGDVEGNTETHVAGSLVEET
jgi:hypothetical protein